MGINNVQVLKSDNLCHAPVSLWSGEYESTCQLVEGHRSDHWDGSFWFNDQGELVDDSTDEGHTDDLPE